MAGTISVPADHVHDARLKLAAQGLPEGDGGFAVMSKEPGFGVSQFMEGARYQHALETELARTISNLQAIEGARVHLALPRQSAFVRDRRAPSASVFLQMKPGRRLESEQVTAIVNLVASSIPELEADQVTVVDQQGRLLSAPEGSDELAAREKQLEIARGMEERYTQRVEQIARAARRSGSRACAGRGRRRAFDDRRSARTVSPRKSDRPQRADGGGEQSQWLRSAGRARCAHESTAGARRRVAAWRCRRRAGRECRSGSCRRPSPDNTSRQATRNYEIDRTVAYTRQPAGRLKRLTVAVLVDNLRTTDEEGEVTETALTPEQLENMTRLVKDAVGFDQARGDSVNVVNASFKGELTPEEVTPDEIPLWERPLVRDVAKLLAGLIVLLVLVLMVLRPLIRGLLATPRVAYAPAALPGGAQGSLPGGQAGGSAARLRRTDFSGALAW